MKSTFFTIAAAATLALAKTDLEGCTSSETVAFGGASMVYWDPTNGEICSFLDCGGGRAPPKTTVPGCPQYAGTATYSPDFLPGWGAASATSAASSMASSSAEESDVNESAGVSVPAYETKTASASSTLVTSKAVLPSGVASASGSAGGYVTGVTTKAGNGTATVSTGSPTNSPPAEASGAAAAVGVAQGLIGGVVAGIFGLAML